MPPLLTLYAILARLFFSVLTRWPCSLLVECFQ
nr:MAG TPA: hypothetical protein [Caudoviricetes sp.]